MAWALSMVLVYCIKEICELNNLWLQPSRALEQKVQGKSNPDVVEDFALRQKLVIGGNMLFGISMAKVLNTINSSRSCGQLF